ncbi:hypothetical protein KW783_00175 [Candidatus Parcubacteria bacterium]|nr:hypothetical protein [Candidatus Parcubacteria bacterium]
MIHKYFSNGTTWLDIEWPTKEDMTHVRDEHNIDPVIIENLLTKSPRQKIERRGDCIYMVLHFPAHKHSHSKDTKQEVDIVLGKNFIITTRYDTIDSLHHFAKKFEVETILNKQDSVNPLGVVFLRLMKELYRSLSDEFAYMQNLLDDIEQTIFLGKEKEMVKELSNVNHILLDFKKVLISHREVLEALVEHSNRQLGDDFDFYSRAVFREYTKAYTTMESQLEFLGELRKTNDSLLTTKQNEIMKTLTVIAIIALPITVISSILQINTTDRPFVGQPHDFFIITGMMLSIAVLLFGYFKYKKWL